MSGREFDHSFLVNRQYGVGRRKEAFGARPGSSVERSRKIIGGPDVANQQFHSQGVRRMFQFL